MGTSIMKRDFYVDDDMIFSHLRDEVSRQIFDFYKIKEGSQDSPMWYLGVVSDNIQTEERREMCKISSRSSITKSIEAIEVCFFMIVNVRFLCLIPGTHFHHITGQSYMSRRS